MLRALLLFVVLPLFLFAGCVVNIPIPGPATPRFVVVGGEGEPVVYLLRLDGIITDTAQRTGILPGQVELGSVESVRVQLDALARENIRPAALLVRINSPGGSITASDIVYHQIRAYKERLGIPVVVLMMDMAASGGYYIAMAGDTVVAHPTTITGSIGVLLPSVNIAGLMEKFGVQDNSITSGPYKDLFSFTRPRPAEHDRILRDIVAEMHGRFVTVVREGRQERLQQPAEQLADGRIYTAVQAQRVGLIDKVGYFDDALAEVRRATGLSSFRLITLAPLREGEQGNIYMNQGAVEARGGGLPGLPGLAPGQPPLSLAPSYLWMPDWAGSAQ